MTLFSFLSRPAAVLAVALAFAMPAQAAMPAQPTLHVTTLPLAQSGAGPSGRSSKRQR